MYTTTIYYKVSSLGDLMECFEIPANFDLTDSKQRKTVMGRCAAHHFSGYGKWHRVLTFLLFEAEFAVIPLAQYQISMQNVPTFNVKERV